MSQAVIHYKPSLHQLFPKSLAMRHKHAVLYQQHPTAAISEGKRERAEHGGIIQMAKVRS